MRPEKLRSAGPTQLGEHAQPRPVERAQQAILKTIATQLAGLEAAIATAIQAKAQFAARAAIIASVPGLGRHTARRMTRRLHADRPARRADGVKPEAAEGGAQSAGLEPGRSPGYPSSSQLLSPLAG